MALDKHFAITGIATGSTVYAVIRRDSDGYFLNDADGAFAAAPADKYLSLPEDGVLLGLFEVDENRAAWDDGVYSVLFYRQVGGSPDLAADPMEESGQLYLWRDAEVTHDRILEHVEAVESLAVQLVSGPVDASLKKLMTQTLEKLRLLTTAVEKQARMKV